MAGRYMRVSSPRYSNQREHRLLPSDLCGSASGQDSLDMFAEMPFLSHFPVVPVYSSTAPLGLNLRAASPVNRMTITGAPSGIAPVPVAHPVVTRLSPDAFVAATRASYQEHSRQVCLITVSLRR